MWNVVLWIYLINATLVITHEIDSAYWKEWELFRIPGGITGFLLIHLPLVFLILWGVVLLVRHSVGGVIVSLVVAAGGVFAFVIHSFFINRGRPEFRTPVSFTLLLATLLVSFLQILAGIHLFIVL